MVLGLMNLLQALGPDLLLPRGAGLTVRYGQVLVGTALGLLIALMALVVRRPDGSAVAESSAAAMPTPSLTQPPNAQEVVDEDGLPPAGTPQELAWMERLWNRAFGVPIWP